MIRSTSLRAFHSLEDSGLLQDQERELMRLVHRFYPSAQFTRKELMAKTPWGWNIISARCNSLIKKKFLTEYPETRDGGHLLSVAQPKAAAIVQVLPLPPQPETITTVTPASHEQLIHTYDMQGKPFAYTAVGFSPGWPPDQDHLHRGKR